MGRTACAIFFITTSVFAISPESLIKSGVGGNPSFMIGLGYGTNPRVAPIEKICQGTLVGRQGGRCSFITAAHCLYGSPYQPVPRFIHTGDFGVLTDFEVVRRGDFTRRDADDLAVVHFTRNCTASADRLVVPVGALPPSPVSPDGVPIEVFAASAAYRQIFAGFLPAKYFPTRNVLSLTLGSNLVVDGERRSEATYSGDSGGGLFLRNERTRALEIVGVLSMGLFTAQTGFSADTGARESIFVVDPDWIKRQAR